MEEDTDELSINVRRHHSHPWNDFQAPFWAGASRLSWYDRHSWHWCPDWVPLLL